MANDMQPLLVELGTEELPVKALPGLAKAFFDGVLAALEKGDTYGYRITQELAEGIGASESTLYPVLRRLQKDGCLEDFLFDVRGCCMALIDPDYKESIYEKVAKEYLKVFPHLEGKFSIHYCHSADGVHLD